MPKDKPEQAFTHTDFACQSLPDPVSVEELDLQLQQWSQAVESAVSQVLQQAAEENLICLDSCQSHTVAAAFLGSVFRAPFRPCPRRPDMASHSQCVKPQV